MGLNVYLGECLRPFLILHDYLQSIALTYLLSTDEFILYIMYAEYLFYAPSGLLNMVSNLVLQLGCKFIIVESILY